MWVNSDRDGYTGGEDKPRQIRGGCTASGTTLWRKYCGVKGCNTVLHGGN